MGMNPSALLFLATSSRDATRLRFEKRVVKRTHDQSDLRARRFRLFSDFQDLSTISAVQNLTQKQVKTMTIKQSFFPPDRPSDGVRDELEGWWISEAEAKERTVGNEEWWKMEGIDGRTVEIRQYDQKGPKNKPIWMWEKGKMYLGEWKMNFFILYPVRHGFGALYYHGSEAYKGWIYIGEYRDGKTHGSGMDFWLESAPCWESNRLIYSSIVENGTSLPFVYSGTYVDNRKEDESATVTLKDGTTRVGPWKHGRPYGDWWEDHKLVTAATTTQQDDLLTSVVKPKQAVLDERKPGARPTEGAKSEHASVNPPQVISLDDSDDNDTGDQANRTVAVAVPDAVVSSQEHATTSTGAQGRVKKIRDWLIAKIAFDPDEEEMALYARNLYDRGYHSVGLIEHLFTKERVEEFDWMKEVHRELLAATLQA